MGEHTVVAGLMGLAFVACGGAAAPSQPAAPATPVAVEHPAQAPTQPPAPAEPETPPASEPEVIEPDPGHAGLPEALASVGACRDQQIDKPERVFRYARATGNVLAVVCENYAYQSAFEMWLEREDGLRPMLDQAGNHLRLLGWPSLDLTTGVLEWVEKARGVGDCGSFYRYQLEGDAFRLSEHRARECDNDAEGAPAPNQWPLVEAGK